MELKTYFLFDGLNNEQANLKKDELYIKNREEHHGCKKKEKESS